MHDLTLWTWNVGTLRGPGVVAGLRSASRTDEGWPEVICLEEAAGTPEHLRRELGHRYRVLVAHGWPEADNLVTLVRRDVPIPRWLAFRMARGWVGPLQGREHAGRTFHLVDLGPRYRVVHVHRVSGGPEGPNAKAWQEEHIRLFRISNRRRSLRRRFIIVGDQNNTRRENKHPLSSGGLADAIGGRVVWTGTKVDHAIIRDAHGDSMLLEHGQEDANAHRYIVSYRFRPGH